MSNLLKRVREHDFFRNVITLATGTTIAQAIPLLIAPVLTRLYTPGDFGLLALFVSITTLLTIVATGRYEVAIVLPTQAKRARRLLRLSLCLTFLFSLFVLILIGSTHRSLISLFADSRMDFWLYLIPLAVLLNGVFESLRYYGIRQKSYNRIAGALTVRSATDGAVQVGAGFAGGQSFGLMAGYLASLFAGNLRLWRIFHKDAREAGEKLNDFRGLKFAAKRYRDFPKFTLPAHFLNAASLQLPVFVFSVFFSGAVVGWYAFAQKVLNAPMTMMGSALGHVFFQKAAEHKHDSQKLRDITWSLYKTLLWAGVFPLCMILVFGEEIFGWIFGAEWAVAGQYAQMLSVWVLFVFISSPLSNLFFVQEKQRQGLVLQSVIFCSRFATLLLCVLLHFDAHLTVLLFGVVGALIFFIFIFYLLSSVGIRKTAILGHTLLALTTGVVPLLIIRLLLCR